MRSDSVLPPQGMLVPFVCLADKRFYVPLKRRSLIIRAKRVSAGMKARSPCRRAAIGTKILSGALKYRTVSHKPLPTHTNYVHL